MATEMRIDRQKSIRLFLVGGPPLWEMKLPQFPSIQHAKTGTAGRAFKICQIPRPNRRSSWSSFRRKYPSGNTTSTSPRSRAARAS